MKFEYPIVVIGAGPAGASAVYSLVRLGIESVIWVDRFGIGRPKACAGGLGPRALKWLERHDLLDSVKRFALPVSSLKFVSPSGKSALLPSNTEAALVARRSDFDSFMVSVAKDEGATLQEHTVVKSVSVDDSAEFVRVETANEEIKASFVFVAAGAIGGVRGVSYPHSTVVKTILARFENFPHSKNTIEMIFDKEVLPYYAWLFPEPDGFVNIGLMAGRRASSKSLHKVLDYILQTHFRSRLLDASMVGKRMGAPIRISTRIGGVVQQKGRVWLVGESAGLVNPATGEGIPYALECGEIAANTLYKYGMASVSIASEHYLKALKKRFGIGLRASDMFVKFASTPFFGAIADVATSDLLKGFARRVLSEV